MSSCSSNGSYHVVAVACAAPHGPFAIDLIVCTATPRSAHSQQAFDVGGVCRVAHQRAVVGEQDRIERKALEAPQVHGGHREAVPGDADEADEVLVACLDGRAQCSVGSQRCLPLVGLHEVVQLDQVHMIR